MRKLFLAHIGETTDFVNARWADVEGTCQGYETYLINTQGAEVLIIKNDERIELFDAIVSLETGEFIFTLTEMTQAPSPEFTQWIHSVRNFKKPEIAMADTTKHDIIIGEQTYNIVATTATDEQFKNNSVIFFNDDDQEFYEADEPEYLYCSIEGNLWLRKYPSETLTYTPFSTTMKRAMKSPLKELRKQSF